MSIRPSWLIGTFKSSLSLMIFCVLILSNIEIVILNSPTIILNLPISPHGSARFCFIYIEALLFDA